MNIYDKKYEQGESGVTSLFLNKHTGKQQYIYTDIRNILSLGGFDPVQRIFLL